MTTSRIYRTLQACTLAILAIGLWQHDWTVIVASIALLATWRLLHEEVEHVARD